MGNNTADEIYGKAAADLAMMIQPDLTGFSEADIETAMAAAFTFSGPRPEWLADFRDSIERDSASATHLEDADPADFPFLVKSPGASYQRLVGPTGTQLVVMGPFEPPFQLVQECR